MTIEYEISSLKNRIHDLEDKLSSLQYEIFGIKSNIQTIIKYQETIMGYISSIQGQLATLSSRFDRLEDEVSELTSRVHTLEKSVNNLREELWETRIYLENRIEDVRQELHDEIINTKRILEKRINDVEKRVDEAREELDEHLTAQDREINISKEGILNVATVQTILTLLQSNPKSHAVVCQVNEKPVIVVDKGDFVQIALICEEPDEEAKKIVDRLRVAIKESTGKTVEGYTVSTIRESEKPIWVANIESIIKLSE